MGLFGRKRKDLTQGGLPGSAVVKSWESADFWDEHATKDSETIRLTDFGVGSYTYRMELEVHLDDGRAPYTVTEKFKVPVDAGDSVQDGVRIPLYADPADQTVLDLNWEAFTGPGGAGAPIDPKVVVRASMPEAARQQMVDGWVQAVQIGNLPRDQFDDALADAVGAGLLTPEEAASATARLA
jgi:hypothetical protein